MERSRCFSSILNGKKYAPNKERDGDVRLDVAQNIILCKYFGRSYEDVMNTPADFCEDAIFRINLENAIRKKEQEKVANKMRSGNRSRRR